MSRSPCTVRSKLNKFKHVWEMDPCAVRFKSNKFEHVLGGGQGQDLYRGWGHVQGALVNRQTDT